MEDTNSNFEIACKISRTAYTMKKNNITVCKIEKPSNETSTPAQEQSNICFLMKNTHVISVEWKMYALVINAYIISCPNVKLCGFDENDIFLEAFDDCEGIDLCDYYIKLVEEKEENYISFRYLVSNNNNFDIIYLKIYKSDKSSIDLYFRSEINGDFVKNIKISFPSSSINYGNIPSLVKMFTPHLIPLLSYFGVQVQCDIYKLNHRNIISISDDNEEKCSICTKLSASSKTKPSYPENNLLINERISSNLKNKYSDIREESKASCANEFEKKQCKRPIQQDSDLKENNKLNYNSNEEELVSALRIISGITGIESEQDRDELNSLSPKSQLSLLPLKKISNQILKLSNDHFEGLITDQCTQTCECEDNNEELEEEDKVETYSISGTIIWVINKLFIMCFHTCIICMLIGPFLKSPCKM